MLFIVISADIRRGREGLTLLTKSVYVKNTGEDGSFDFVKVRGESSKNHQLGSENIMNAGIIPFEKHEN